VLPGVYNISLLVDGKTVDTKPLRVTADPEVVLTDAERRKMFDMAMELHELQRRGTEAANAIVPLGPRMAELSKEIEGRTDLPADLKASFDAVNKELTALAPRISPPAGGRGGFGGGGAPTSPVARLAQAKNALMGTMWPTEQILRAYTDSKAELPRLIAEAQGLLTKASALSTALAKHNLTLTVPTLK
jgi:hypothetical protein